jgi:hypothetical protein
MYSKKAEQDVASTVALISFSGTLPKAWDDIPLFNVSTQLNWRLTVYHCAS